MTSASTTVVSCALTCRDSTIRLAMTARRRDIFSVRPRTEVSGLAAGDGVRPAGAPPAAAAPGGLRPAFSAAASTSCLRIRPPTPLPDTDAEVDAVLAASRRTSGVT